ncbi:MAG: heliorhodopsin HeR [Actinomycetota bacterium]|nr:heliorhodopsin HeR [Actinomycetota bacterium]
MIQAIGAASSRRLRLYNLGAGLLHTVQAASVLAFADAFSLPVRASYMTGPPGPGVGTRTVTLFDIRFAWAIAAFFGLSALAHFVIAWPAWPSYLAQLARHRNPYRWLEYSVSASIMIVLIAMLSGIDNIAALIALVGVNAAMIGFGWLQELYESPGGSLRPFWLGSLAGAVPWLAIGVYLVGPGTALHPPAFVYAIFVSLFVAFNCFAVNQWLQYRRVGRWREYLVGERVYITLSLVAKSLLAWQIFASALASAGAH